jgi:hypothetical protein
MKQTYRILRGALAILAFLVAPWVGTVQPVLAAASCASSSPTSGMYTVTICFSSPASGSVLTGDTTVTATISVTGTNPGTQRMIFYLDGAYMLTDYQSAYSFTLPTARWIDGSHTLAVGALMRDGFTSQQASISVSFNNGVTTPPVNTNQFQPSSGIPPINGAPFIVAAGGDGASGETNAGNVSNLIVSLNPNLFLYLGDVYEKGSVTEFYNWYGTSATNFGRFRSITDPTIGNHEYTGGKAPGYFDYWNNIPSYYSYNAGGWHFISLNSNYLYEPVGPLSTQFKWLQQDLAANSGVCTIAYYHHPFFDIGPEGSTVQMSDIWKLLAQYGVDIVVNGHDHDYQRWVPLDGNGNPNPTGITEFVVGSSGHGMQTITNSDSRVAYSNATNPAAFGVLLLQLNQSSANFSYRSINGSTLDSGVIPCVTFGSTTATATPTSTSTPTATATATSISVPTSTSTPTATATPTGIPLPTSTSTPTATATATSISVPTSTSTPTATATATSISMPTNTSTPTATATPTAAVGQSVTFAPVADTYVNAGSTGTNYGTSTTLRADGSPDVHSYIRFSVLGLGGKTILRARLLLFANSSLSQGINALAVADNTWGELTTNYTNAPALGNSLASSGAIATGSWVTLDVTSYISGEGTFSFGITTPSSTAISLASRESGANSPQLIIGLK